MLTVLPVRFDGWNASVRAASVTIKQIATEGSHSLVLLSDGFLYAWVGNNTYGQLSDRTIVDRNTPTAVNFPSLPTLTPISNVTSIAISQSTV